jgi:hypothetical protein
MGVGRIAQKRNAEAHPTPSGQSEGWPTGLEERDALWLCACTFGTNLLPPGIPIPFWHSIPSPSARRRCTSSTPSWPPLSFYVNSQNVRSLPRFADVRFMPGRFGTLRAFRHSPRVRLGKDHPPTRPRKPPPKKCHPPATPKPSPLRGPHTPKSGQGTLRDFRRFSIGR